MLQKKKINSLKWIFTSILSFSIMYFFIAVPKLTIDISSNTSGESHIFYKYENGQYSGKFSKNQDINNGRQTLKYKLQSYEDQLRWDPVEAPFNIEIHQIFITVSGLRIPIPFEKISGSNQIQSIIKKDTKLIITSTDLASDPNLFFQVDLYMINLYRILLSIIYTFITLTIIKLLLLSRSKLSKAIQSIESKMEALLSTIDTHSFDFKLLGVLSVISIFLHIFAVSNFMISIDDELSALRTAPEVWIWDGRWTGYLIEAFIFPQPTMPYIPNLISSFLLAFSFILVIKSHNLEANWKIYITYPIFVVFPTLWFIDEFYGNVIMIAVGFFITSLSVYIISREDMLNRKFLSLKYLQSLLIPSILLAFAIGAYQSFIMLFIAMGAGSILARNILFESGEKSIRIFLSLSKLTVVLFLGMIFYGVINLYFRATCKSQPEISSHKHRVRNLSCTIASQASISIILANNTLKTSIFPFFKRARVLIGTETLFFL